MEQNEKRLRFARALLGAGRDHSQRDQVVERVMSGVHRETAGKEERKLLPADACRPGERCVPTVCFSCHSTCEAIA